MDCIIRNVLRDSSLNIYLFSWAFPRKETQKSSSDVPMKIRVTSVFVLFRKATGILTRLMVAVNIVLLYALISLNVKRHFCVKNDKYFSSVHLFVLTLWINITKYIQVWSASCNLEQSPLVSFVPVSLEVPLKSPWLTPLMSSFIEGDFRKSSLAPVKYLTSEADWWVYSFD